MSVGHISKRLRLLGAIAAVTTFMAACAPNASPHPISMPDGEPGTLSGLRVVRGAPGRIVDTNGRDVQLRGVNLNSLGDYFEVDPRLPTVQPLDPATWSRFAELGYNVVRLVTTWSAWEPERDLIDEDYVQRVQDAVEGANAAGIYVVIDMHQDAWSKEIYTPADVTCPEGTSPQIGWDGAPGWATLTHGASACGQGGGPGGREENAAVKTAWGSFYSNEDGIRDELAELWGFIAERFAGNDGIAGYDLLNEPGFSHDQTQTNNGLVAFYNSAIREIRSAEGRAGAPPRIVFFEGVLGTVPITPLDFSDDPDLVFAPHNYAESIGASVPGLLELLSSATLALGALYRTPVWVGEYGAFSGDGASWLNRFGIAYDTPGFVGGTWWQWNSECGDPHALAALWPLSEEEIVERSAGCSGPTSHDPSTRTHPACTMRSYPVAAPGLSNYRAQPCGGSLGVWGASQRDGAPTPSEVDLWYQPPRDGDAAQAPVVTGEGIGTVVMSQHAGGWRVTVGVEGPYRLQVAPSSA